MKAAHFDWQVRRQLEAILGGARRGRDRRVHGHHDARHEGPGPRREVADRRRDRPQRQPQEGRRPARSRSRSRKSDRSWVRALRGKDLHNGALVALDYRTGDVLAYAGSAGYNRTT